jgi:hypothetical protein
MNGHGFWRNVGTGLLASFAGTVAYHVVAPLAGSDVALRGTIVLLAAIAALALLLDRSHRVGRFVAFAAWLAVLAALLVFDPSLWLWAGVPVFALWLMRSLSRYQSLWQAGADAAIALFAFATAWVALRHTHSVFLALWCFFLVQALTSLIPHARPATPSPAGDRYDQAQRNAEAALRRLASPN